MIWTYIPPVNKQRDEMDRKRNALKLLEGLLEQIQKDYNNPNLIIFADTNINLSQENKTNG